MERKYLRAVDIVAMTGMSLRTVRRWISAGAIPSVKLGGARLVAEVELERLFSLSNTTEGTRNADEELA